MSTSNLRRMGSKSMTLLSVGECFRTKTSSSPLPDDVEIKIDDRDEFGDRNKSCFTGICNWLCGRTDPAHDQNDFVDFVDSEDDQKISDFAGPEDEQIISDDFAEDGQFDLGDSAGAGQNQPNQSHDSGADEASPKSPSKKDLLLLSAATVAGDLNLIKKFQRDCDEAGVSFKEWHDNHTSKLSPIQIAALDQNTEIYDFYRMHGIEDLPHEISYGWYDYVYKCLRAMMHRNKLELITALEKFRRERVYHFDKLYTSELKYDEDDFNQLVTEVEELQQDFIEVYMQRDAMLREQLLPRADWRSINTLYDAAPQSLQEEIHDEIITPFWAKVPKGGQLWKFKNIVDAIDRLATRELDDFFEEGEKFDIKKALHPDRINNVFHDSDSSIHAELNHISKLMYSDDPKSLDADDPKSWPAEVQAGSYLKNNLIEAHAVVPMIEMYGEDGLTWFSPAGLNGLWRAIAGKLQATLPPAGVTDMLGMLGEARDMLGESELQDDDDV